VVKEINIFDLFNSSGSLLSAVVNEKLSRHFCEFELVIGISLGILDSKSNFSGIVSWL